MAEYLIGTLVNLLVGQDVIKEKEQLQNLLCHPWHKIDQILATYSEEAMLFLYLDTLYLTLMFSGNSGKSNSPIQSVLLHFRTCVLEKIETKDEHLINKELKKMYVQALKRWHQKSLPPKK